MKECGHGREHECEHEHIGYQLKSLDHMFRRHMDAAIRENGFEGMSVMNGWIIKFLDENEGRPVYQKDMEKKFNVGRSSLAGTLKIMEEKGFIERVSVARDARLKQVLLTDKGRTYMQKMEEDRERLESRVIKGLSEEELSTFRNIIRKMKENLSEQ